MRNRFITRTRNIIAATVLTSVPVLGMMASSASAVSLTQSYLRLTRMKTAQTTPVRAVFRTTAAGATTLAINFNGADTTTWTGSTGAVAAAQTAATAACATETGFTALPGTLVAAGAGSTVTITGVTALAATTTYCVDLTSASAVTNPTVGEYHPTITAGSEATTVALRVITDDQVVVSAIVAPAFNFVIDANTTSFTGNLDSTLIRSTTGRTVTINTNATNGWITWVKDSNQGLTSAAAAKTITTSGAVDATPSTLTAGTEGYVLDVDLTTDAAAGGTVTIAPEYNGAATGGGTLSATYQPAASSNGTAAGDVITLVGKAAISATTPSAADYTDTWTIIGAGTF